MSQVVLEQDGRRWAADLRDPLSLAMPLDFDGVQPNHFGAPRAHSAALVDGATRWQAFKLVTLPLLRPTLLPAVVLGSVWTFNMFNVVFLVSGGEPDGTTDILVSEAYHWAFARNAQFGYAAAYAVIIFGLLALMTRVLGNVERRSETR